MREGLLKCAVVYGGTCLTFTLPTISYLIVNTYLAVTTHHLLIVKERTQLYEYCMNDLSVYITIVDTSALKFYHLITVFP